MMILENINKKWITYKEQFGLDNPLLIEEVRFDASKGTDASFNIAELYSGSYILHLSKEFTLYRSEFTEYVLWHEFTHLYDFLNQPYVWKVLRKLYHYMNSYSEYHASRRSLGKIIGEGAIDPDKSIIPLAYRDISLRQLISETVTQAAIALKHYEAENSPSVFNVYFRYVMYLMGYASHFANADDILGYCFEYLQTPTDHYFKMYDILKNKNYKDILPQMEIIYDEMGLKFD